MKRKNLLKLVGAICLAAVIAIAFLPGCAKEAPAPAPEEALTLENMEPTIWRVQSPDVLGSSGTRVEETFKEEIEAKTNGKLTVEIYPSLGLGLDHTKAISHVRDGVLEMGHIDGAYCHGDFYTGDVGDFWYLIPYDMECQTAVAEALSPQFDKALSTEHNQYFISLVFGWPFGILTGDKEIKCLDDMKGLKLRAKGVYMNELVDSLGATAVAMPATEIYEAMSKGMVDGGISCPGFFEPRKFWEVGNYFFDFRTGCSTIFYTVNKDEFDALPSQVQDWVVEALHHGVQDARDMLMGSNADHLQGLKDHGITVHDISPQDIEKINQVTQPFIDKYVAKGGAPAEQAINTIKTTVAEWQAKQ